MPNTKTAKKKTASKKVVKLPKALASTVKAFEALESGYGAVSAWVKVLSKGLSFEAAKTKQAAQLASLKADKNIDGKSTHYAAFRTFSKTASRGLILLYGKEKKPAKKKPAAGAKQEHETTADVDLKEANATDVLANVFSRLIVDQKLTPYELSLEIDAAFKIATKKEMVDILTKGDIKKAA